MSNKVKYNLQPYPRKEGGFLAEDYLFPQSPKMNEEKFKFSIKKAFERTLTEKK